MSQDNIGWGAQRIHGELRMLGIQVSQSTVTKYMLRHRKPPSQSWRIFLNSHTKNLVATDLLTVPTETFRVLYVFLILRHDRRRVVRFNTTKHPTPQWTVQQIIEAFPWDSAPRYLLRDRDKAYGTIFRRLVHSLDIRKVLTAPQSLWQHFYVERLIGSIRRDCLNHVIVFNEHHLKRLLHAYFVFMKPHYVLTEWEHKRNVL
jgi:hypothetical protein